MSESEEQREIVRWFRVTYPEHGMSLRVSMSGLNYGSGKRGAILAKHVRSQGVVAGESDIAILLKRGVYGALLIEHKADGSAHKATPDQERYIEYHNAIGNCAIITRGVEAAKAAITAYMGSGCGDR